MFTEYTVLDKTLGEMDEQPVNHFFNNLLDVDLSNDFHCDVCGTSPKTIIMDATTISFRKTLASWRLPLAQLSTYGYTKGRKISVQVILATVKVYNI